MDVGQIHGQQVPGDEEQEREDAEGPARPPPHRDADQLIG